MSRARPWCSVACCAAGWCLSVWLAAAVQAQAPAGPSSERMVAAAGRLLAALPEAARTKVQRPFDDADRFDWHYIPRTRNGVALKELDGKGREAVHALSLEVGSHAYGG